MAGDSSDEDYEYGKKFLAYDPAQLTPGHGPPQNGHDFLKMVEEERLKLMPKKRPSEQEPEDSEDMEDEDEGDEQEFTGDEEIDIVEEQEREQTYPIEPTVVNKLGCNNDRHVVKPKVPSIPPLSAIPNITSIEESEASMLMSWYMAGYHRGYHEAMKKFKG